MLHSFRVFNSFLEIEGFQRLMVDMSANDGVLEPSGMVSFKKLIFFLKYVIFSWISLKGTR